jgi:hypothetical protein
MSAIDMLTIYFGFQFFTRACASESCAGVSFLATDCRPSTALALAA